MHIFIDESGQFIPLDGAKSRAAATVALVVPTSAHIALRRAFRRLKKRMGSSGLEVKGSSLSEEETAQVIALLQGYDVIVEAVVLDVGDHTEEATSDFKTRQADRLTANITRRHHPELIQDLLNVQEDMNALPNQLFLQMFCMWQLIPRVIETATMYYSQRRPAELGSFVWRVDAKDRSVTTMERLWTTLVGPVIMARSVGNPMGMIPGADYSYYERFDAPPSEGSVPAAGHYYTDMKKVLREDFAFTPSVADLGLQATDIIASILTRALNGTLQEPGWDALGSLFVRRSEQTVHLVELSEADVARWRDVVDPHWAAVVRQIELRARPMLTEETKRLARKGDA